MFRAFSDYLGDTSVSSPSAPIITSSPSVERGDFVATTTSPSFIGDPHLRAAENRHWTGGHHGNNNMNSISADPNEEYCRHSRAMVDIQPPINEDCGATAGDCTIAPGGGRSQKNPSHNALGSGHHHTHQHYPIDNVVGNNSLSLDHQLPAKQQQQRHNSNQHHLHQLHERQSHHRHQQHFHLPVMSPRSMMPASAAATSTAAATTVMTSVDNNQYSRHAGSSQTTASRLASVTTAVAAMAIGGEQQTIGDEMRGKGKRR